VGHFIDYRVEKYEVKYYLYFKLSKSVYKTFVRIFLTKSKMVVSTKTTTEQQNHNCLNVSCTWRV